MKYDRKQYLDALSSQLDPKIVNHSLALEACMGGIYDFLQSQEQLPVTELPRDDWLLAGLLHDIDFGGEYKEEHPKHTREALAKYGIEITDEVHQTILAHAAKHSGIEPQTKAQWAIFCADSLTGLIMAVAYVYPSRKLADVKVKSVLKRFLKEPKFAAGTRRDEVALCSKPEGLNMPLEKFIEICLAAMQKISADIGV